jgi:spermidine synthase
MRAPESEVIRIGEDGGRAALLVDGVVQSISPEDGLLTGGYWGAMVPAQPPTSALILGLGGGTLARLLQSRWGFDFPIVGIDNDVAIVETALGAGWLPDEGLHVVYADAFTWVRDCSERFDYVAIDLFRAEQIVGQAFSRPFLRQVRRLMAPSGVLAANLFRDYLHPGRVERIASIFDIDRTVTVGGNIIVHARRKGKR